MFESKAEWKAHFCCLLIAAGLAIAFFIWSERDPDVAHFFNIVRWPMVSFLLLAFLLNGAAYFKVRHDPVEHIKKMQSFLKTRGVDAASVVIHKVDQKRYEVKLSDGQTLCVMIHKGKVVEI